MGLSGSEKAPDATTIRRFREALSQAGLIRKLFQAFDKQLCARGCQAAKGQIVDANIVPARKQRNRREENGAIEEGGPPEDWSEAKRRQKDVDARWTQKRGRSYFGYKNHITVDARGKFIRGYQVTAANAHDSQVFEELLAENTSRDLWADSAYMSAAHLEKLKALHYRPHIQRKGRRNQPLSEWEQQGNRTRARIRSRVEHVSHIQIQRAGTLLIRTLGLVRAAAKIGLRNLAYNMDRLGLLLAQN